MTERYERLQHLEQELQLLTSSWRWYPLVQFLMVLRGIRFLSAMTLVAELGDIRRFAHPRSLMNFVGLTPSEYSSGKRQQQGAITKCGNTHARRILIEAAWAYRFSPKISREVQIRQQDLSLPLQRRKQSHADNQTREYQQGQPPTLTCQWHIHLGFYCRI